MFSQQPDETIGDVDSEVTSMTGDEIDDDDEEVDAVSTNSRDSLLAFANPNKQRDDTFTAPKTPVQSTPAFKTPVHIPQRYDTTSVISDVSDEGEKLDFLSKLYQLRDNGHAVKDMNIRNKTTEIKLEVHRVSRSLEIKSSVKFQQRILMAIISALEFLNRRFDPFDIQLDGWSENVMENIDDFSTIFEKLHDKYRRRAQLEPEIELLLAISGSAFMFNLTNTLFKQSQNINLSDLQSTINAQLQRQQPPPPQQQQQQNEPSTTFFQTIQQVAQQAQQQQQQQQPQPVFDQHQFFQQQSQTQVQDDDDRFSISSSSSESTREPSREHMKQPTVVRARQAPPPQRRRGGGGPVRKGKEITI